MQAISIPPDLQPHADFICDIFHEALADSEVGTADEVRVLRPAAKQFGVGEVTMVMLLIGGSSVSWFTKKWLDEYVWPVLKKHVDKPSRQIMDFLSVYVTRSVK